MTRELAVIVEDLKAGRLAEPVTVRTFLSWFGAQRRGWQIVHYIREQLAEAGLKTVPDFESRWIDAPIGFQWSDADQSSRGVPADVAVPAANGSPGANPPADPV